MNSPSLKRPGTVSLRSLYMSKKASEPRIRQANGKTIRPPPTHDQAHEPYKVKKASATKAAFRVDDSLLQKFASKCARQSSLTVLTSRF